MTDPKVGKARGESWGGLFRSGGGTTMPLLSNPFFLREWWIYRRARGAGRSRRLLNGAFLLVPITLGMLGSLAQVSSLRPVEGLLLGWLASFVLWLLLLSYWAMRSTSDVFETERELGALATVELTAVSARSEVLGRWAGNLLPVAETWAMGVILVGVPVIAPLFTLGLRDLAWRALWIWLFSAVWAGVIAAVALAFSASRAKATQAATATLVTFTLSVMFWGAAASRDVGGGVFRVLPLPGGDLSRWMAMPPQFTVFPLLAFENPAPTLAQMTFLLLLWVLFGWAVLRLATRSVEAGVPLRFQGPQTQSGGGVVPHALAAAPLIRYSRPRVTRRGLVDRMLSRHATNPYFAAWRSGYMRLYPNDTALPGSVVPPALMAVGLLFHVLLQTCVTHTPHDSEAANLLVILTMVMLALACFISGIEAMSLAQRSMQSERNQSTWPLLVVTGMSPERLVAGKFCSCFYALCGEWTVLIPIWIVLGLLHPPVLLLALFHPLSIALGALLGLVLAGEYRMPFRSALLALASAAAFLLLYPLAVTGQMGDLPRHAAESILALINVPHAVFLLTAGATATDMITGVAFCYTYAFALYMGVCLMWRTAVTALRPSLLEAASGDH